MKKILLLLVIALGLAQCNTSKDTTMGGDRDKAATEVASVRIANDSLEYEIIIMDIGFPRFLTTQQPESYFDINYLERRNQFFVAEYNRRVLNIQFSRDLYPQRIAYDPTVHYGKEVNYLLFQYFRYFTREYNQNFPGLRN